MINAYLKERLGALSGDVTVISEPLTDKKDADFAVYTEDGKTVIYAPIA